MSQRLVANVLSVVLLLFSFSVPSMAGGVIRVCLDESEWYPFTFVKYGAASGIHIDIIKHASGRIGMPLVFVAMPWKRCLREASQGRVDAVATASYNDDRAAFLKYPDDASLAGKSPHRVMQVEYVIVTMSNDSFEFDNNIEDIPRPVRAPRGYSVVADLNKLGIPVDDNAASDEINIRKLLREGRGTVVVIPEMAEKLNQNPAYKGKLKISQKPWKSKSYFLPFSKKSRISDQDIRRLWDEIEKVREDSLFMAEQARKYSIN
ncbi:substrate-binding periplasmic protein [Alkalimarinus coralli]|uniref:substrate-binding periplasmic protein n=1 Tax=Alkalimarinus coralli TaxID=2935863 RepID=UPI00202AF6E2|nr:transporter substrate-binding domain-containing protein [Alkalimarinus coralli]